MQKQITREAREERIEKKEVYGLFRVQTLNKSVQESQSFLQIHIHNPQNVCQKNMQLREKKQHQEQEVLYTN